MVLSPSTPRMQGSGFFKHFTTPKDKPKKTVYYEDRYSSPNEDEAFDRFPDACESELDSEDEESERFSKSGDYKRFFDGSYTGSSFRDTAQVETAAAGKKIAPDFEKRYKISPDKSPNQSMELPSWEGVGMVEGKSFGETTEEQGILDGPNSADIGHRRLKTSSRMVRPASRRLFSQQLVERDKKRQKGIAERKKEEKREIFKARRKVKAAMRRANVSKVAAKLKDNTHKKAKLMKDLGGDEANSEGGNAYVLIDLSEIDVEDYEYCSV